MGDPHAVAPLLSAVKDAYLRSRTLDATEPGEVVRARVLPPWTSALRRGLGELDRSEDVWALRRIGRPAVSPLLAALKDPEAAVRVAAALGLSGADDERVIAPLISAFEDQDEDVWSSAAWALGEITKGPQHWRRASEGTGEAVLASLVAACKNGH